jgi:hypothetical protein
MICKKASCRGLFYSLHETSEISDKNQRFSPKQTLIFKKISHGISYKRETILLKLVQGI